ncbi:TetR/AcrR family transcriptional regulator [Amycolatopsis sp. NPDC051106]|uniref:TetR/AcrR family transcriptional regulator n=1 Tax=unclassified Amycolatopsis TaxID=2618356 RepID=UPI0034145F2A
MNTARELPLESGPTAVTHAQVADRAGVGRATVYRHWPQAEPLLALDDVRAVSTTLANTALWDETIDARRAQFAGILADRLAAALDDAQARGEITLALPSRNAAAMAIGPMYYRSTIEHAPTDSTLIEAVVAALGTWSTER